MTATLPAGLKVCPGWTSEYTKLTGVDRDGYTSTYSMTKASGEAVKHACGGSSVNRRRADPGLIRDGQVMCSRCRKQKTKFDNENGAQLRREERQRADYEGLIEAYKNDVLVALDGTATADLGIRAYLSAVDGLVARDDRPPYARYGEAGFRSWADRKVDDANKLNVLRSLAGLDLVPGRYGW